MQSLCSASGSTGIVSSLAIGGVLFEVSVLLIYVLTTRKYCIAQLPSSNLIQVAGFWLVFVLPAAVIVAVALSMLLFLPHCGKHKFSFSLNNFS